MKGTICIGRPLSVNVDRYGRWSITPCGWVTAHDWELIQHFQSPPPPLPPSFPQRSADDLMRETKRWDGSPWAAEVESRIRANPTKSCLWTIDLGGVAECVTLGRETLAPVDWFTRNIFRPVLSGICSVVNIFKD